MRRVLFVVGSALGHAARAVKLARGLSARGFHVHIAGSDLHGFTREVVASEFPLHRLHGEGEDVEGFAAELTRCVETLSPTLLCYDLTPLPCLALAPRFAVPEVFVTNVFLTRLGSEGTFQDDCLAKNGVNWNDLRIERGLHPLTEGRSLYERDLVLLADPPALVANLELPTNYRVIGPCTWNPPTPLPDAVRPLEDVLYISMGSTGAPPPEKFLRRLADELECREIVALGEAKALRRLTPHVHRRLPGSEVLERARFALTQGGTGSAYQALEQGVPIGCWPGHRNHQVLGRWLERLGLGALFEPGSCERRLDGLRARLPELRRRALEFARSFSGLDGALEAGKHIEALLEARCAGASRAL